MKVMPVIIMICLLLGLFVTAQNAYAQNSFEAGPLSTMPPAAELKQLANKFYKRCQAKPDATLNATEQEEYCVCLSAQMYRKTLEPEERQYLATGEGAAIDYRRAIAEVYGPCIGIPGRVATYQQCTMSRSVYKLVKTENDMKAMCQCVLREMNDYWDVVAPAFLEVEMRHRRGVEDPLKFLMSGRHYPVTYAEKLSECVSHYGRRD